MLTYRWMKLVETNLAEIRSFCGTAGAAERSVSAKTGSETGKEALQ